jgi:predicted DNA-binding transcriptional regulator YafY
MPAVKTGVRARVKHSNERIELIDQLLYQFKHFSTRKDFLAQVNQRLPIEENITASTLDKDLKYLRTLLDDVDHNNNGVELLYSKERGFRYSDPYFSYFKNSVTEDEKNLLLLANSLFNVFKGTPLHNQFSTIVNKVLSESLTGKPVHGLSELTFIQLETGNASVGNQWIPQLLDAIYNKDSLIMKYCGLNKPEKTKHICPYVLKQYHGKWYLVAYDYNCARPDKTSVFSLDGIQLLDISNKPYFIDPNFNASDYFKYSIGVWHWHEQTPVKVILEFSKHFDRIMASPIHHSQQCDLNKDGNKLRVELEVYQSPELEMLIQSYGSAVKVISPDSLIDRIKSGAQKVTALYD